ncbi:LADA_0A00958g1_1 [Lachancea dasiensis]|uniref:LADA_0A00958g1_1 n=1 Tax=Lachancea dasiensis TaxID=1072105 RepID=A0A1G4ILQ8_9SACH|nr:LADA_0A00958g1_1 [Lachancea dasiensis]
MDHGDPVEKALELGAVYFKNEDFHSALNLFTKALKLALSYDQETLEKIRISHGLSERPVPGMGELVHARLVKLLDNRAATWEKLGNLAKALKDANRAVRYEPFNLKCYLRRGKVLQKLGKDQEALENYDSGLSKVHEMETQWYTTPPARLVGLLKGQKTLVKERMKPAVPLQDEKPRAKRVPILPPKESFLERTKNHKRGSSIKLDIVGQCPLEMLKGILLNLDTNQLIHCMKVSKIWHARICMLPEVFRKFDLSPCSTRAISSFLEFINVIYRGNQRGLIEMIKYSSSSSSVDARTISSLIRKLKPRLRTLILNSKTIDFEQLTVCLAANRKLVASLEELSLCVDFRTNRAGQLDCLFLESFSNVRKLELIFPGCAGPSRGNFLSEPRPLNVQYHNLKNLETFKLICDLKLMGASFPLKSLFSLGDLPQLTKVYICGVSFDYATDFEWLKKMPNLRELWLENNRNIFLDDFLRALVYQPLFRNLTKLTLREHRVSNQAVNLIQYPDLLENATFIENIKSLVSLDLMCTSIGSRGLLKLLSLFATDQLKKLNIGDCPYIHFQRGEGNGFMNIKDLILLIPHVEELLLHQSVALDDHTIKEFSRHVKNLKKLRKLDLSFNVALTGVSIYELLRAFKEEFMILQKVVVDGCPSIMERTATALKQGDLVREFSCMYDKDSWKVYGVNTLVK